MGTNLLKKEFNKALDHLIEERKNNSSISIAEPTVSQYAKNYLLLSRLRGAALCLLKTQFAKKPKNPV